MGLDVRAFQIAAFALGSAIAGIGGGLYAHMTTYVEPRIFDVMLGVHSLAYGLIGGLGTAFGPLLGVLIDIGVLESIRTFAGFRMIIFGGLVAALLIFRPRGLLDECVVHRIAGAWLRVSQCDSIAAILVGWAVPRISAFMWPWAISNSAKTSVQAAASRKDFLKKAVSCLRMRCQAEMPSTKKPAVR